VVTPNWQIPLRLGERTLLLEGDVTWVPGPSPWPWALVAAAVLALLGGVLPDLTALARSQLPTAVGPAVTRAAIAVTLGLGAAMVVAGLLGFRSERLLAPPPDTA
jgi:hypothetical protein